MTTFYLIDENGYLTGEEIEADECPPNGLPNLPMIERPGFRPWFNGIAWDFLPAVDDSRPLAVLKDQMYDLIDSRKYIRDPKYSREEVASWPAQRAEAEKFLIDGTVGPYMQALADTEESMEVLANKIIETATAYEAERAAFAGKVILIRTRVSNAVRVSDLPDPVEVMRIKQ